MIVITGGAGFIGSTLANFFRDEEIIIIDCYEKNLQHYYLTQVNINTRFVNLDDCISALEKFKDKIKYFYHFGANSSTDQTDLAETIKLNITWSQYFWDFCTLNEIPFIYASSAATYGDGSKGFSDEMPLNKLQKIHINGLYGWSKMYFDLFVINQAYKNIAPPKWYGLKFFNVYGINEKHKGNQSSVIHPFLRQLRESGKVYLFKSYMEDVLDGEQKRDFVSVNYCIEFINTLTKIEIDNGIYNVGTGKPKTFLEFSNDIMEAAQISGSVEYIEMPINLRAHYQYFTKSENIKSKKIHDSINDFKYKEDLKYIVDHLINES